MASILSAGTTNSTALNLTADTSGSLILASNNNVTAVTIATNQNVTFANNATFPTTIGVGGATPSASGSGISFPASQSASSNANTLDDYEEGTWTPTDGSGAGLSFTGVEATYTKIGRFAFFEFQVTYPSTVSGADTRINGFPFNNIDNYEGKPGVCLVSGFASGFFTQKQGTNYGYIVNASNSNITNTQASTRTARGALYYATT